MGLSHRYDFVLLFDVQDGNPNGDPDAGNLPRVDAETGHGLVTDVCLKRKIRNYVQLTRSGGPGYKIFVREKAVLNALIEEPYVQSDKVKASLAEWEAWRKNKRGARPSRATEDLARDWMCENYFDIRAFGAVMSTGDTQPEDGSGSKIRMTAGQVRGPVQMTFARSSLPIVAAEHAITRMAVTNEKDLDKERTMGRKFTVPYGIYLSHGFVSASLAQQTGFSEDDLKLLWEALRNMFEHDRSAARGLMATRGLYVFEHDGLLGNAPAHTLFERIVVNPRTPATPARSFADFEVTVNTDGMPGGVKLHALA